MLFRSHDDGGYDDGASGDGDCDGAVLLSAERPRIVLTQSMQRDADILRMWLTQLAHVYFGHAPNSSSTASADSSNANPSGVTAPAAAASAGASSAPAKAAAHSHAHSHGHNAGRWPPIVLVGPEGSGKSLLLRHVLAPLKGVTVAYLHCSGQTKAAHVVQKLMDLCTLTSTANGRVRIRTTHSLINGLNC